jgi:hypothetical protein
VYSERKLSLWVWYVSRDRDESGEYFEEYNGGDSSGRTFGRTFGGDSVFLLSTEREASSRTS